MELCKCSPAPRKKCCFQNCVWKDWGFLEPPEAVRDEQVTRNKGYGHPEGLRKVFLHTALRFASISYFPYKEPGFFCALNFFFPPSIDRIKMHCHVLGSAVSGGSSLIQCCDPCPVLHSHGIWSFPSWPAR